MAIHVSATTGCNLGCTYCYENPSREMQENWVEREYDIEAIMDKLKDWKEEYPHIQPGMHGGEPLLVRDEDLERIFRWICKNYDGNGGHIQTNATMLTEQHIKMFKRYNVSVGVSCDGPGELNKHRVAHSGDSDVTELMSERTLDNIERLVESDVNVGVITVLHEGNAGTEEKVERLLNWMDFLTENGVGGHFNPALPYEDVQTDISLSGERLFEVYKQVWEWIKEEDYRSWNPFADYVDNLLGNQLGNCVNNKCDPFNAGSAKIIKGNGETTACGKTWAAVGDGGPFLQGPSSDNEYNSDEERYDALKNTPGPYTEDAPDMGGCKGCKYWNVCRGGCPGGGQRDDYRNRVEWCPAIYGIYEMLENEIRNVFPNIRLITDYPWNLPLGDIAMQGQLDIKPFAAMRPAGTGDSSAWDNYELSDDEKLVNVLPDGLRDELEGEELRFLLEEEYDPDLLTIEDDGGWHADNATRRSRLKARGEDPNKPQRTPRDTTRQQGKMGYDGDSHSSWHKIDKEFREDKASDADEVDLDDDFVTDMDDGTEEATSD